MMYICGPGFYHVYMDKPHHWRGKGEEDYIDYLDAMFCWESFSPGIHMYAAWHAEPTQKPLPTECYPC